MKTAKLLLSTFTKSYEDQIQKLHDKEENDRAVMNYLNKQFNEKKTT